MLSSNLPVRVGTIDQPDFTTGLALSLPQDVSLRKLSPQTRLGLEQNQTAGFYDPFGVRLNINPDGTQLRASYTDTEVVVAIGANPYHRVSTDGNVLSSETSLVAGALIAASADQIKSIGETGIVILSPTGQGEQTWGARAFAVPKSALREEFRDRFKGPDDALYLINPHLLRPEPMKQPSDPLPFVDDFRPAAVISGVFLF